MIPCLFHRLPALTSTRPLLTAWLAYAVYCMITAAFVQFVVLPEWLPELHAGLGLLANSDAAGYHQIAARAAEHINAGGWANWVPSPDGQSAAGLAAPFYAVFGPRPWILIPINAFLHAATGALVIVLLRKIGISWRFAVAGGTLWVIMPSSLQWVAQIQKDGYFFAGMLAALLAWIQLLELICGQGGWARLIRAAILLAAGVASVAFSRVYGIQLLQIAGCAIAAVSLIAAARHGLRACPAVALLLIVALPWALSFSPSDNRLQAEPPAANSPTATGRNEAETILLRQWHRSGWLPEFAERTLLRLCIARQGFVMEPYRSAGSTLDADVVFANAGDIIRYLPRAVQIGFLAPFPNQWLEPGKSTGGGIMRRIAALEMTVVYLTILLGLPLAVCLWRKTPWLWLTVGFCSLIVIADAYAIPNVGTLYRLRYGFLMTVAALGLAAILTYSERVSARLVPPANG